jgi:hypothetical protein
MDDPAGSGPRDAAPANAVLLPEDRATEARRPWLRDEARVITAGLALGLVGANSLVATLWNLAHFDHLTWYFAGTTTLWIARGLSGDIFSIVVAVALVRLRPQAPRLLKIAIGVQGYFAVLALGRLAEPHRYAPVPLVSVCSLVLALLALLRLVQLLRHPGTDQVFTPAHRFLLDRTPDLTRQRPWNRDPLLIAWVLWHLVVIRLIPYSWY